MSDSTASLQRKISTATDLQSVVRTMKALAASNIGQYEQSVLALADYYRVVELGLGACFREAKLATTNPDKNAVKRITDKKKINVLVFGSDQGLVGQFNDVIADYTIKTLKEIVGKPQIWAVGERIYARLADAGVQVVGQFPVPNGVKAIAPLIGQIQIHIEASQSNDDPIPFYVFYNHPQAGALFEPVHQRLLPFDLPWQLALTKVPWPTKILPELMSSGVTTLRALISEYLYIALFRACAESLASENASRLATMQRADQNIDELMLSLHSMFHRLRQTSIDEELFDVIGGYESIEK